MIHALVIIGSVIGLVVFIGVIGIVVWICLNNDGQMFP